MCADKCNSSDMAAAKEAIMAARIDMQVSQATELDENEFELVLLFSLGGLTLSLYLFRLLGDALCCVG
jgi:hypothetical protein